MLYLQDVARRATLRMQSAKSGVSRVLGLPARLISVPKAYIRSCHVLTVTGALLCEHRYPPSAIYNVDETGFSIGSSRKSVVLLNQLKTRREKRQPGRQEWITSLECVNAAGVTLPPCLIFKGENLNSG